MKESYVARNKNTGEFFVGKTTQTGYTELRFLKRAIKYQGKKLEDYDFYVMGVDLVVQTVE